MLAAAAAPAAGTARHRSSCGRSSPGCRSPAATAPWTTGSRPASPSAAGRGVVRAKTGTLTGVSSLAGRGDRRRRPAAGVRADVQRRRARGRSARGWTRSPPSSAAAAAADRRSAGVGARGAHRWHVAWGGCADAIDDCPAPASGPSSTRGLPVDWELARRTAARLMPPGPDGEPRRGRRAGPHGCAPTPPSPRGTSATSPGWAQGLPLLPADVVDRPAWAAAAVDGMAALTAGARLPARARRSPAPSPRATAGLQVGGRARLPRRAGARPVRPVRRRRTAQGRLLLVAPERATPPSRPSTCPSADFGLWVCLHEATHRLQFTAVPWLRDLLRRRGRPVPVDRAERRRAAAILERLPEALSRDPRLRRRLAGARRAAAGPRAAGRARPAARAHHPAGGPRRPRDGRRRPGRRAERRDDPGPVHRAPPRRRAWSTGCCARCSGVEAKVRQYAVGSAFTRHVVLAAGMDGFNRVWETPGDPAHPRRAGRPRRLAAPRPRPVTAGVGADAAGRARGP